MNKVRMLAAGVLVAATAALAIAAEEQNVPTVTVTAKRLGAAAPAVQGLPPQADIRIQVIMPTDMPEAEIDYHLSPVGAPPAPAVKAQ